MMSKRCAEFKCQAERSVFTFHTYHIDFFMTFAFRESINVLQGDIVERDCLLDAIRGDLGPTQSENCALRQEIAALKTDTS